MAGGAAARMAPCETLRAAVNATAVGRIMRIMMLLRRARIGGWPGRGLLSWRIGQESGRPRNPPAPSVPLPAVRWRVFP